MDRASDTDAAATVSCADCEACCCRLEDLLAGEDKIPVRFTAEDRWGGAVMRRLADGWCAAVDRDTMRCVIYERRPVMSAVSTGWETVTASSNGAGSSPGGTPMITVDAGQAQSWELDAEVFLPPMLSAKLTRIG